MAQILPKLRIRSGEPIGQELFFANPELQDEERSFLDADSAVGVTSLTASGINFAANQYIVLGQIGQEKTEIVQISGTPTATNISLATATVFAHNRGDMIRFIAYNQLTPERSTDAGATFSALSAIAIRPDASETYLQRASDASTDVYRFRFYNSTSTNYSAYSDTATASGYADNTVYSIRKRALQSLGEKKTDLINDQFLIDSLSEARREVDQDERILRWSFRTKFNTNIGTMIPGNWRVAAPTDLRDRNTYKNILQLRTGKLGRPVTYQDNKTFRLNYQNIVHTTLNGAVSISDTSIVLTFSGDLPASGTIKIAPNLAAGSIVTVTYTGNTKATGTLTGCTGVTAAFATGNDVWSSNMVAGDYPTFYTIDNGYIYFDRPFSDTTTAKGNSIDMDYYQALQVLTNDGSLLDEPYYDMYVSYLKYKIKYQKANGKINRNTDSDYIEYIARINKLVAQELTGQFVQFVPVSGFGGGLSTGFDGYGMR